MCWLKLKAKRIIELMNDWALPSLIDSWDNTGFQIGDSEKEISRILIALDLDKRVLEKAIKEDFHMIITHHPLIFKPMKSITTLSYKEKLIYNLIKNEIVVYNAHTNLDQAENGVNDELARLLGLKDLKVLCSNDESKTNDIGYGKVGNISNIKLIDYVEKIKKALGVNKLKVYGNIDKEINRVAVCGGSGADFIYNAFKEKACAYITGDIKYHDAQLADELGLTLIDAGHYHTEKIILPVIKSYLNQNYEELYIEVWDKPSPIYNIY